MSVLPPVVFEPLHAEVVIPNRATAGAAGYDVRAYVRGRTIEGYHGTEPLQIQPSGDKLTIPAQARVAVPLGFRVSMPHGLEAQLRLRSSIAFRRGLVMPNAPATIDADYPGEWLVVVTNTLTVPVEIEHQERIAQIVFARVEAPHIVPGTVGISTERSGGVGSTGRFGIEARPPSG